MQRKENETEKKKGKQKKEILVERSTEGKRRKTNSWKKKAIVFSEGKSGG